MLWYKGWRETRFRLLFALGVVVFYLASGYSIGIKAQGGQAQGALQSAVGGAWLAVALIGAMLSGAGVTTQPAVQATKGLHGSMLFTLSLPVSRFRLLATRASLGWLEMTAVTGILCCGMWILFPVVRGTATGLEMLGFAATLIACGSGLYSIPVLLGTFLDDLWRMWGTMITIAALWWLSYRAPLPTFANIIRAMVQGSPLLAHAMPWTAMAFSLGLAAVLFFAALKIVQNREY